MEKSNLSTIHQVSMHRLLRLPYIYDSVVMRGTRLGRMYLMGSSCESIARMLIGVSVSISGS